MAIKFELSREYIEEIKAAIENNDEAAAFNMVKDLHPADIAEIYRGLTIDEAKYAFLLLDYEKAADAIIELEENERKQLLESISGEVIAKQFVEQMDSDDAADLIGELSNEKKEDVLRNIDNYDHAIDLIDLMSYDEDSAGGLMAKELIKIKIDWDIETCIKEIRKQANEIDNVYYVYVVDDKDILLGTVSLKRILLARSNAKVKNILNPDIISVKTSSHSDEVAMIMKKYDLVALPVVDAINRLMGRITIDDVVDIIQEEAEKDYQMISGITHDVEPYDNVLALTKARVPWLFIGLLGGILGAQVITLFESEIKIDPKLAIFVPLIAAMGGNVGVQSSSIVVQGLANQTIEFYSTWKKLWKELSIALINAVLFSSLILVYNMIFSSSLELTLTVSSALFTVILMASLFGTFIPLFLNKFKIDPALATGPFITTMNDILGLFIYFWFGRILYGIL